jgi:hypothetical protein
MGFFSDQIVSDSGATVCHAILEGFRGRCVFFTRTKVLPYWCKSTGDEDETGFFSEVLFYVCHAPDMRLFQRHLLYFCTSKAGTPVRNPSRFF